MTNTYIPEDAWSAQGNSPAETGVLKQEDPVRSEQWIQWERSVVTMLMASEAQQKIQQAAAGQVLEAEQDKFPQQPDQQVPWMAQSMSGEVPLERMQQRIAGAPEPQKTALMKHVQRIQTGRRIWDWFYQRGQQRGQLDSNVMGMGWAENVGAPATFQSSGVDALYDEVKNFTSTGLVSMKPPGFEHSLMDKASRLGLTGIMGALAPDPDKSPLVLPSEAGHEMSQSHLGRIAMEAAKAGYEDATSQMSFGAKGVQKLEQMAGFLLPGGPMIGAGKSLAIRGAETLMGRSLGAVGRVLAGGAGVAGALGSYEAAKGLPSHYQEMVDRIAEQKGPEAAEEAKGKLWALHLGMQIPAAILMETMGAAAKPLESAIAGKVTKGINVLDEGGERIAQAGIGNFAREKAAQAAGGAAQGVGLSVGSQVSEDTVTREAIKQITGEDPGIRTSLMRAWASVFDPRVSPDERLKLFKDAGRDILSEGAAFGAYSALQAIRPRIEAAGPLESFRRLEEAITPAARAAARRDPVLRLEANKLFPSSPEVADVDMEVKAPPTPLSEKPAAEGGPSEGPGLPSAAAPPEEPASVQPPEEPKLPTPLSDRERVSVAGQLQPGTTFRMKDIFGGRELTVVGGKLQVDKKGRWGGGIRVKDGDREITIIPEMLDQVDSASIAKPVADGGVGGTPDREQPAVPGTAPGVPQQVAGQPEVAGQPAAKRVRGRVEQLEHPFDIVTGKGERVPVEIERSKTDPSQFIAKVEEPGQGLAYFGGTLTEIHDKIEKGLKEKGWKSVEATSPFGKAAIDLKRETAEYEAQVKALSIEQGKAEMRRVQKRKEEAQRLTEERQRAVAEELARRGEAGRAPEGDIIDTVSGIASGLESVRREMAISGSTPELKAKLDEHLAAFRGIPPNVWAKARETPEGRTLSELLRTMATGITVKGGASYVHEGLMHKGREGERGAAIAPHIIAGRFVKKLFELISKDPEPMGAELRRQMTFDSWKKSKNFITKALKLAFADESLRSGPEIAHIKRDMIYNEQAALLKAVDYIYHDEMTRFMNGVKPGSDLSVALVGAVENFGTPEAEPFRDIIREELGEKGLERIGRIQEFHREARRLILRYHPETARLREAVEDTAAAIARAEARQEADPKEWRRKQIDKWREELPAKKEALKEHLRTWGLDWKTYIHHAFEAYKSVNPKARTEGERLYKRVQQSASVAFRALKERKGAEGYVPDLVVAMTRYIPGMVRWIFFGRAKRQLKDLHDGQKKSIGTPYKNDKGDVVDPMDRIKPGDQLFYGPDAVKVVSKTEESVTVRSVGSVSEDVGGHFPDVTLPIKNARWELSKLAGGLAQAAAEGPGGFEEEVFKKQMERFLKRYPTINGFVDRAALTLEHTVGKTFYTLAAFHPLRSIADWVIAWPWMVGEVGPVDAVAYHGRASRALAYYAAQRMAGEDRAVGLFGKQARADWIVMKGTGMVFGVGRRDFMTEGLLDPEKHGVAKVRDMAFKTAMGVWNAKEALMHGAMALAKWERNPQLGRDERMNAARDAIERTAGTYASPLAPGVIQSPWTRWATKLLGWSIRQPSYLLRDVKEAKARDRAEKKKFIDAFTVGNHNWNKVFRKLLAFGLMAYLMQELFGTDVASSYGFRIKQGPWIGKLVRSAELAYNVNLDWLFVPGVPETWKHPIAVSWLEMLGFAASDRPASEREEEGKLRQIGRMLFTSLPYEVQEYYNAQVDKQGNYVIRHPADRAQAFFPWEKLTGPEKERVPDRLMDWLSRIRPGTPLDTMMRMEARSAIKEQHDIATDLAQQRTEALIQRMRATTPEEKAKWGAKAQALTKQIGTPPDYNEVFRQARTYDLDDSERFMFSGASAEERAAYLMNHYLRMKSARPEIVKRARVDILGSESLKNETRKLMIEKTRAWLEKAPK